jgi:TniQ protein
MSEIMEQLFLFDEINPLVITPRPYQGESPLGFLLRTSEANGYPSINTLYRLAGLTENEARSARPPMAKLAPIFNRTASDFEMPEEVVKTSKRYLNVAGHSLPAIYLRSKHARVCPDCVRELEHVQAFWELKHAVVCPVHRRMALSECPHCNTPIDWWRKGLTVCSCGHDFSDWQGDIIESEATLAFLQVLHAKCMGDVLNEQKLQELAFPVEDLQRMSLSTLIGIIARLENFSSLENNQQPIAGLETAAGIFTAWPSGFNRYLEIVHAPNADLKARGLRGQFESFYEAFFKQGLPAGEMTFMHKAFVKFGQQQWRKAAIHPRLSPSNGNSIVGIGGLARAYGIQPSTARRLVSKGIFREITSSDFSSNRELFDLSRQLPFEFSIGKSVGLRAAAETLGIPATVLRAYRQKGFYQVRYLASPLTSFHEQDLMDFRTEMMADCRPYLQYEKSYNVTLQKAMRMKLDIEDKMRLLEAVRKREIVPLGKRGDCPGHLVFLKEQIARFLSGADRLDIDSISIETAATQLHVDRKTVFALIGAGSLSCRYNGTESRICKEDMKRFSEEFISCKRLAALKKLSQKSLIHLCRQLNINFYQIGNANRISKNVFILRSQLPLMGINTESWLAAA